MAEMPLLEQLGTQERQKLAKKRRLQQLKKWGQREKEWISKEKQLNKRLANKLNEENNGLNLKQYTIYNSNQRTKKKLISNNNASSVIISGANNNNNNSITNVDKTNTHLNDTKNNNNNNNVVVVDGPFTNRHEKTLTPNGKVHFDVGVMLLEAAARNDFEEVKRLLSLGVSPDSINHDGLTALHQCCIDASEPMMNLLLEFGANVDARDTERWTPLHAACTCGHLNLVKILVDYQADLLAVNGDGNMPFDICDDEETLNYIESQMVKRGITQEMIDSTRASGERQMLNELEELVRQDRLEELNAADQMGVTPLHVASSNNYLSVVKFLLKHDVNVNVCDNDQWRPLHGVACWGNEQYVKIVELLVEAGASLDAKTQNDETVFDLCDNIDLLERLNQLKDELENKQASGTDRLRRTQSRTNSRVHSVRRTSVRDKNQISRREAREEALLRVESETSENGLGQQAQSNGAQAASTNASQQVTTTDQVGRTNSSQSSSEAAKGQTSHLETNLDQLDGVVAPSETNGISSNVENQNHHQNRSQTSEDETKSGDCSVNETKSMQNGHHATQTVTGTRLLADDHPGDTNQTPVASKALPREISVTMENRLAGPTTTMTTTTTINDCDSTPRGSQTTTVQVHYAPINYTLSNLKKHRSDLRMRTSTIGGHNNGMALSLSSTSANGNGHANGYNNHSFASLPVEVKATANKTTSTPATRAVQLDPEPVESATCEMDGRRPQSPGPTFRKFHGEPSEAIDCDVGRKGRHMKCCILI